MKLPTIFKRRAQLRRCRERLAAMPDPEGKRAWLLEELRERKNINASDGSGETALHLACELNDADGVRLLLEHGASPHCRGLNGQTPLYRTESAEIAGLLLAAGADPNARDVNDWVPLHAVNVQVARVLIAHGAELMARDQADMTPLYWAEEPEKLALLLEAGARLCEDDYYHAALFHSQHEGELEAWLAARGGCLAEMPQTPKMEEALRQGQKRDEQRAALDAQLRQMQEELLREQLPPELAERVLAQMKG